MNIYTPTTVNPFTEFNSGDLIEVALAGNTYKGKVTGFPSNGANDTDIRMQVEPADRSWVGRMVISAESNWYGQWHISQVKLRKINNANPVKL